MNNLPEPRRGCLRVLPGFTRVESDLFADETNGAKVTRTHNRPRSTCSEVSSPSFRGSRQWSRRSLPSGSGLTQPWGIFPGASVQGRNTEAPSLKPRGKHRCLFLLVGRGAGRCGQQGCKATSGQLSWRNPSVAGPESPWTRGAPSQVGTDT